MCLPSLKQHSFLEIQQIHKKVVLAMNITSLSPVPFCIISKYSSSIFLNKLEYQTNPITISTSPSHDNIGRIDDLHFLTDYNIHN
jgi:hypothetical protein